MTPRLRYRDNSRPHKTRNPRNSAAKPKKRHLLPSPLTSRSLEEESSRLLQPDPQDFSRRSRSAPESTGPAVHHPTYHPQGQKRRRIEAECQVKEGPSAPQKRRQTTRILETSTEERGPEKEAPETCTPVSFWARTGHWPVNFATMSQEPSISSKKRPSSSSYTQSFKDGDVPKAHTAAHEKHLAEHGLVMEELKGRSQVGEEGKSLCERLLRGIHPEPEYTAFPLPKFLEVWQRAQNRNESRVYRDLTPLLVPSPELLWICGDDQLEHVTEEISVEWTKGKTLGGPKPKPDLAVGIASSAFTEEEMAKLKNHRSFQRPTIFTDNMYYPFLLCEAKCGDEGINRADRQNMHSSSLAVDAILQLHRAVGESNVKELNGQILVFSISHDNERVKLYGHFAVVEGDRSSFYRYPIASFVLNFDEGRGRKRTYDFVREIYHMFYPIHLQRICDALASMKDPRTVSMTSHMNVEENESQEQDPSAHSSQEIAEFRKPGTPASKKQKGELALLREQLHQQRQQNAALLEQMERQRKESEEQRKESEEQRKELMKMLMEQSAQIKGLLEKR